MLARELRTWDSAAPSTFSSRATLASKREGARHPRQRWPATAMASFVCFSRQSGCRVHPSPSRRLAPVSSFIPRFIARAVSRSLCRRERIKSSSRAGPNTRPRPRRSRSRTPELIGSRSFSSGTDPIVQDELGFPAITTCMRPAAHITRSRARGSSRREDMWRQILGEDLNVGCVLSWGPGLLVCPGSSFSGRVKISPRCRPPGIP